MNIFAIISAAFVALGTGYSIYLLYRHKQKLNNTPGLMLSMVIAIIAGLLSGGIMGISSGEAFLVVGVSLIVGFIIGFLAGHPIGLLAILMGSIFGLIGGINGALLGLFLQFINPTILLGILLGFYIVITGFVIMYIHVTTTNKSSIETEELSPFAIIGGGVVLISLFLFLYSSDWVKLPSETDSSSAQTTQETSSQTQTSTEADATSDSSPTVKIDITNQGYSPNVIRVKKGSTVELDINNPLENNSCLSTFMIPDFNITNVNLKTGTTKLTFTADKVGQFTFSCGMQMFKGTIIVE